MSATLSYLEELNPKQREAVTTIDGPVLVLAGPGSGKTRVLTYRIAYLMDQGIPPYEILALTFTNKSAKEMKARIAKVVGPKANNLWAGTFHSIFARILRVEADKIGYPTNFTIYDSDDAKNLVKTIIKDKNFNKDMYPVNAIYSRISLCKNNVITPRLYATREDLMIQDSKAKRPHFHAIYVEYMKRCKRSGAMDFDDLLYQLLRLFQENKDGVLDKYRKRFKYVLVDEFQDTNTLQYTLISRLVKYPGSASNLCVVGDDAQSIYAFRGATIKNILDFGTDYPQGQSIRLEQNYRSTKHIIEAANALIKNNSKQLNKEIWTDKSDAEKIQLIQTSSDAEEGKRVADSILEQKNRHHLMNSDIAILYRTNAQSRAFEENLRRFNIKYKVYGGMSFYQRKEVKDVIAYLRLIANPKDDEAFRRIINFPKRGVGKTSVDRLSDFANANEMFLFDAIGKAVVPKKAMQQMMLFKSMINSIRVNIEEADAYEIIQEVMKKAKITAELKKDNSIEGMSRSENVIALLDAVKEFVEDDEIIDEVAVPDKLLHTYLQNVALLSPQDGDKDDNNHVSMMTIHAAKGLEYKSVFVVGMEESIFPSFMSMEKPEDIEEERRLFYVAITRAEQFLTISNAKSRYRFGEMRYNKPSRFLDEIPFENINGAKEVKILTPGGIAKSRVSGFTAPTRDASPITGVQMQNFKPDHHSKMQEGLTVLHLKFGKGKIVKIDGGVDKRIASINFEDLTGQDKRIMLKFAKLQIVE